MFVSYLLIDCYFDEFILWRLHTENYYMPSSQHKRCKNFDKKTCQTSTKFIVKSLQQFRLHLYTYYVIKYLVNILSISIEFIPMNKIFIIFSLRLIDFLSNNSFFYFTGGIRGTMVAQWTTGQPVERSNLRQEHDSKQNSSNSSRLSPGQYSLTMQNRGGLKHQSFHCILFYFTYGTNIWITWGNRS